MACCPAHDDHEPSLSIRDAATARSGPLPCGLHQDTCHCRSAVAWSVAEKSLAPFKRSVPRAASTRQPDRKDIKRSKPRSPSGVRDAGRRNAGRDISRLARTASPGAADAPLPCRTETPLGGIWPAMVALVTRGIDDTPLAIHRTFLARDGRSKAPVDPQKMMLGPCRGGAVRLAPAGDVLMVGEGIETCLAAMQATGHPAWAALSTSGLRTLDLPDECAM